MNESCLSQENIKNRSNAYTLATIICIALIFITIKTLTSNYNSGFSKQVTKIINFLMGVYSMNIPEEIRKRASDLENGHKPFYLMSPVEYRETLSFFRKDKNTYLDKYTEIQSRDFTIRQDDTDILARHYQVKEKSDNAVIMYVFGGGFVEGNIESQDEHCRLISKKTGLDVISFNYRLSPEFKHPIPFNDVELVYRWICDNLLGKEYEKLYGCGFSSGANLLSLLCHKNSQNSSFKISKLVLINPCLDLSRSFPSHQAFSDGVALSQKDLDWHFNHYLNLSDDRASETVSPVFFKGDVPCFPEALIIVSSYCPFVDEGKFYYEKIRQNSGNEAFLVSFDKLHVDFVFDVEEEESPMITEISNFYIK